MAAVGPHFSPTQRDGRDARGPTTACVTSGPSVPSLSSFPSGTFLKRGPADGEQRFCLFFVHFVGGKLCFYVFPSTVAMDIYIFLIVY